MNRITAKMIALSGDPTHLGLQAAADYLGTGAIEVPIFEREIMDIIRRTSITMQRLASAQCPATGHPHRYFEQTAVAQAAAVDPRNLSATTTGPTRVERPAFIKAATAQSNLSLFDRDVTEQQGQFASVVAKDVDDIISAIERLRAQMFWSGNDTSLMTPTQLQWMGALAQITLQFTISPAASIIDGLKSQVALMLANQLYKPKPSAIYVNPVLGDYIDQELKAAKLELKPVEVVAGVTVGGLSTQAGVLPIIGDAFMPTDAGAAYGFGAPPGGNQNYYAAILSEDDIEIPVISGKEFNPNPRLFQLGLVGNLAGQFVGVKFDTLVVKGAAYAHSVGVVQRP